MSHDYLRPSRMVAQFARLYPKAWRQIDDLRSKRKELGGWPDWCFLPLAGAFAIVSRGSRLRSLEQVRHVGILGALATWRATKGIYRFDPTIFDALWETPVTGDIPTEVLYHLPEWCVYVTTPDKTWHGRIMHGFFAHLEHDVKDRRTELRFVFDVTGPDGDELIVVPIHLGAGGVADGIAAMLRESSRHAPVPFQTPVGLIEGLADDLSPLVSLVLYLCSQAAEIHDRSGKDDQTTRLRAVKTKMGMRLVPPERPVTWDVGYRLGSALRKGMGTGEADEDRNGSHAGPRPHIRRAHWHSYWIGKRDGLEARSVVLKWLSPIPINVQDVDDLTPTVRRVAME